VTVELARHGRARRLALGIKRLIDVTGATFALVVLSPVLLWTAVALLATQGRPIFFRHERPGLHGRPFTMVKFRTMRQPRPDEVWYSTDAMRITRLGRLLRSMSIDELPQLWNVLNGDMSLVGPRPLLTEYLDRYTPDEQRRHEMKPGITGWAAVNGRNTARFEDRLRLDVWYVDHWSLALDIRIVAMTVLQVLRRTDARSVQEFDEIEFPDRFMEGLEAGSRPPDAVDRTGPTGGADEPGAR
jgi:lipopolysaccharide/colanic/teichoic acid biosynthesis glycosyltransferase